MTHADLLIDGKPVPARENHIYEVFSPATGEVVGTAADADTGDIDRAVSSAQATFEAWSKLTAYEREKIIRRATGHARGKASEIGLLMANEQGKPLDQSRSEVTSSCDTIDYYASEGLRIEGATNPTEQPDLRSWTIYQPVGVCALITPWNYPISLLSWKLGPALAAGCSCVVKPPPATPLSPSAFCRALIEGGIPAGVINVVTGASAEVGKKLVEHPDVAKVAFTGSTATGKQIMSAVAPSLKKITLELGGQCPAIVCADANLDLAARVIAYKGFRNMGQSCSSVNRVYAHRSVHDSLVEKLRAIAEKLTIGDGVADGSVDLGPMTTADSLEKVCRHVADALEKGAKLVCGGHRPAGEGYERGNYYLPTILTGATSDMLMMREETFGPVVPFVVFDDLDEAIRMANDTCYGLVSYLFTRDMTTTVRVSEALEAGTVCVNTGAVNTSYGPYAGWKDSGFGLELSRDAIYEYLKIKHVKVQLS